MPDVPEKMVKPPVVREHLPGLAAGLPDLDPAARGARHPAIRNAYHANHEFILINLRTGATFDSGILRAPAGTRGNGR